MSPTHYRLVVKGELGARYASAFEGMTISAHDGITEITGEIIDPSHLQGLLERIAGLGLTLHSVTPLETENGEAAAQPQTRPNPTGHDRTPESSQPDRRYSSAADDDAGWQMHIPLAGVGESHPGTHLKGS